MSDDEDKKPAAKRFRCEVIEERWSGPTSETVEVEADHPPFEMAPDDREDGIDVIPNGVHPLTDIQMGTKHYNSPKMSVKVLTKRAVEELQFHHNKMCRMAYRNIISKWKERARVKWITWDPKMPFPFADEWYAVEDRMFFGNCEFCKQAGQYGLWCDDCTFDYQYPKYFKPLARQHDGHIFNPLFVAHYFGHRKIRMTMPQKTGAPAMGTWIWEFNFDVDYEEFRWRKFDIEFKIESYNLLHVQW